MADVSAQPTTDGWMGSRALEYWLMAYKRTWRGSVFSDLLSPVLFLAAMGFGLGTLVPGGIGGVPYVEFIAPGLLAASAMQSAVGESTFTVMGAVKWQRQYHAMLAAPLRVVDVLLGHLAYVALRVAIASSVFLLVAAALGAITTPAAVLALPVAVLCGMAFAAPIFGFACRQENTIGFAVVFRFVVMPMFLFSGTFFPVSQLPAVLEQVAYVTPLWHAVELCRDLCLGTVSPLAAFGHVGYLMLWVVGGLVVAQWSFTKRLVE
ncbi:MAG TPA: ABC transporter permease [Actinomycetales bacterium]|nr:ABC transporter permease [Actinomycetales bacterium]